MKFEDLENLWSAQTPVSPTPIEFDGLKRLASVELRRRRRMHSYGILLSVVFLMAYPLVTIENFRYQNSGDAGGYWLEFAFWMVVMAVALVLGIRGIWKLGMHAGQSPGTLRDVTKAELAQVQEEMRGITWLRWILPPVGVLILVGTRNGPSSAGHAGGGYVLGATFSVGLLTVVAIVYLWHYRKYLVPARDRLAKILQELS